MKEKFDRNVEHVNIGEIGVNKSDGITSDETLEAIKEINKGYNRKLFAKLVNLYGVSNAKAIYLQMQKEGEEEFNYLKSISETFDTDDLDVAKRKM